MEYVRHQLVPGERAAGTVDGFPGLFLLVSWLLQPLAKLCTGSLFSRPTQTLYQADRIQLLEL